MRELPQNLQAERGLLGAIISDNDSLFETIGLLSKGDFWEPANGELYIICRDQITAGRRVTPTTVLHDLSQDADIGGIKASAYIDMLVDQAPPSNVVRELATVIRELAVRRAAIGLATGLIERAQTAPASTAAQELLAEFEANLAAVSSAADFGVRHFAEVGDEVLNRIAVALKTEKPAGLAPGLKAMQDLGGALMPGRVYFVAGAPGSGKSALAQQIATYVAKTEAVLVIEAEMGADELVERHLASETGIAGDAIERAVLRLADYEPLHDANERARKLKLYVDAAASPTVSAIRGKALRMKRTVGLGLIVIDHLLYLRKPEFRMNENEAIRANLQALKQMAKDLDLPVMVLAPLKAEYAKAPEVRRPELGDIYNNGAVEQEADVIIFVHNEESQLSKREPPENDPRRAEWLDRINRARGKAELILVKRRGGKGTGVRTLGFTGARFLFSDAIPVFR